MTFESRAELFNFLNNKSVWFKAKYLYKAKITRQFAHCVYV